MSRTSWLIAGSVCVLGASVSMWWTQQSGANDSELGARLRRTEEMLSSMQERVERANDRPGTTREVVTRVEVPASPVAEAERTVNAKAPRDEVDPLERAAERLDTEGRDPLWAPETERTLQSAYRTPTLSGSRLGEVRCASSLCRMSFTHDDDAAAAKFRENVSLTNPLPDSSVLVHMAENAGGEYESTVFVKRPAPSRN